MVALLFILSCASIALLGFAMGYLYGGDAGWRAGLKYMREVHWRSKDQ